MTVNFLKKVRYRNDFWDKCNDEDYVQDVMAKGNFDYDVQSIESIVGIQQIIYQGSIWHQHHKYKSYKTDKYIKKWMCRWGNTNTYHCPAMVATNLNVDAVVIESKYLDHTHELDPEGQY